MSITKQVPVNADGGYWYITKPVPSSSTPNRKVIPVSPPFIAWHGVVDGVEYVAVRTPHALPDSYDIEEVSAEEVFSIVGDGVPEGRIDGK